MSAMVEPDKFEAARDAMLEELERVRRDGIAPEELAKAVKQFTAGTLASRKTMQGQAQDLGGSWMSANDLNFSARYLEAVKQATAGDIQRVARQYLTAENRTLYALLVKGTTPARLEQKDHYTETPVQKFDLPNGLRLLVKENHRLPFVEFRTVCQGGVLAETESNNGATMLMARMMMQGTRTRTAAQIATEMESLGGSIDTYAGNNSFGVNAEVLSSDFATGLELMADVLLNPSFPGEAFEREQQIQLGNIRAQRDELLHSASRAMRRELFGNCGYGLHSLGTEKSVGSLTTKQTASLHAKLAVPTNCVLAIFGDVDTAMVKRAVEQRFAAWKRGDETTSKFPPATFPQKQKKVVETRDKKQAVMVVGFPGATLESSDRYALELLQEACSDLGSRLFLRIRENLGLAYYVGAQNFIGLTPGFFAFYVGTAPEKIDLVESELLKEAELLRSEGLSEEELKRAKAKVIGQKKIARQDLGGYAMNSALDELYGLGYLHSDQEDAQYEAVTLEQVKAAARKFLKAENSVISIIKGSDQ
jgi:zinc protease